MAKQKLNGIPLTQKELMTPTRDHEYDRQVAREHKARQERAKKAAKARAKKNK